jgi:hypothetical protein
LLPEALDAARSIGSEYLRALALAGLAPHFPEVLPEALDAARSIGDESYRALALAGLGPHLPEVLPEVLDAARSIGSEYYRALALEGLAPHLPEVLPEALDAARSIGDESDRARTLAALLTRFTFESSFWQKILHALASLNRNDFLENLPQLAPLIMQLGGIDTLKEVVKDMRDVNRWWR